MQNTHANKCATQQMPPPAHEPTQPARYMHVVVCRLNLNSENCIYCPTENKKKSSPAAICILLKTDIAGRMRTVVFVCAIVSGLCLCFGDARDILCRALVLFNVHRLPTLRPGQGFICLTLPGFNKN